MTHRALIFRLTIVNTGFLMPQITGCDSPESRYLPVSSISILSLGLFFVCLLLIALPTRAFESLTTAQNLIYDRAHLSNTVAGQQIVYGYHGQLTPDEAVDDQVVLNVNKEHADDRRDVGVEFLTAERRMFLPEFTAFRGNPVIIAMLEHIAQRMGHATGGGVLYFRNRIRDALAAHQVGIETVDTEFNGNKVEATRITFMPFAGDSYLAQQPEYTAANFSITLSDHVPGGVVGVAARSGQKGQSQFVYEIELNQ